METLTKRSTKGSNLTHAEMDGNWDKIMDGVTAVETQIGVSLNADGTVKNEKVAYAATTNATDNYAVAIPGTIASLSDLAGRVIMVLIDAPNTGPATLMINGTLTDNILKQGGQPLASGDIKAGVNAFMWDATSAAFLLVSPPGTNSRANYGLTTNVGNDYTITVASLNGATFEVPELYYAGYRVLAKLNAAPTGAMRLKVAVTSPVIDLGFADVRKYGSAVIESGDLAANQIYEFVHDGSNFQLVGPTNNEAIRKFTATGIVVPTAIGNLSADVVHGLGGVPDGVHWRFVRGSGAASVAHGYVTGDTMSLDACYNTADIFNPWSMRESATILQLCYQGISAIAHKTSGGRTAITEAQLRADFTLSVTAFRFTT